MDKKINDEKVKKLCPQCGKIFSVWKEEEKELIQKIGNILKSHKGIYEKKLALFKTLNNLDLGETEPNEKRRIDCLLQGKFYNELAKQNLKEYKELTINALNK